MPAETETSPPAGKNAFTAAFEKAMEGATDDLNTPPDGEKADETPTKKEEQKQEKPPEGEKKSATPRELFKKPEVEKKAETPAETKSVADEIATPDFKNDTKAKSGWEQLKGKLKEYEGLAKTHETKAKELAAKLAEYEPLKTQLAEREAKLKEYDEIVARARIEDHPDFRKEFIDGREKLISRAKEIIEDAGGDAKAVETALNLKGKARVDALEAVSENLGKFQTGMLGQVIRELTDLDARAQEKREKAKDSYKQLQEQDQQRKSEEAARRAQTRAGEFDETTRRLRGELEVLKHADGHDEWNARADRIVREARAFVDEHPSADIEAEILSRAVPAYRDLFIQADERAEKLAVENARMAEELKTIHSKRPSLNGRTAQSGGADKSSRTPFTDTFKEHVGES